MNNKYDLKLLPYIHDFIKDLLFDYQTDDNNSYPPLFIKIQIDKNTKYPESLADEKDSITILINNNFKQFSINNNTVSIDLNIEGSIHTIQFNLENIVLVAIPDANFCIDLSNMLNDYVSKSKIKAQIMDIL